MTERLRHIDGLRGLAILGVVGYHAYTRWPELVPYGDRFAAWAPFSFGWLGVELFFLISGFVILMTLQRCDSVLTFLGRRWQRLFPAMAVCSSLIFVTGFWLVERPFGVPTAEGLLPGLTFTEPNWWRVLLHHEPQPLEGAFWSLYVEFKFYVIAALVYFAVGPARLVLVLFGLYLSSLGVQHLHAAMPGVEGIARLDGLLRVHLSLIYFGWFAAGAAYHCHRQTRDDRWFHLATAMALCSAVFVRPELPGAAQAAFIVALLFAVAMVSQRLQAVLSCRMLQGLGFISYPLYLLHENMMIAMTIKLGHAWPWMPQGLLPIVPMLFIGAVAWAVAAHVEPHAARALRRAWQRMDQRMRPS